MAQSKQARKRNRQAEIRRVRNKSVRNEIKSLTKNLQASIAANDADGAQKLLRQVTSKLDKAAKRHVYHRNAASRQKSRISSLLKRLAAPTS